MSIPREWDSVPMTTGNNQMNITGDMQSQFAGLNIQATPFIPNIHAQPFVPGGPPSGGFGHTSPYYQHNMGLPPGLYPQPNVGRMPPSDGYMRAGHPYSGAGGMMPNYPGDGHYDRASGFHHQPMQQPQQWQQQQQQEGSGDVDSWEDIAADEQQSQQTDTSSDTHSSTTTPPHPTTTIATTTSETPDNMDTATPPSSSSLAGQSLTKETSSSEASLQPNETEMAATGISKVGSDSELVLKDHSSPSITLVPKLKTVVAPHKSENDKENVNIVFIGHVDAGKSTIGGHVMFLTGQVDKRTLEKYEREAKEKNRETWYLAWALDTNLEERAKGKTVETGRAFFETEKKRFTILDAPGHAGFVPNMISGAAQGDIGILVISARKGEFETGFERRGQTREHAMLVKIAGVKHLVVLINKMDDPTVKWSEERYEECKTKLTPFLKTVGFNPKTDIYFIPVSGLSGTNLKDVVETSVCPWYHGSAFIKYLDDYPPIVRDDGGPLRMPVVDKYKDMGTMVIGIIQAGAVTRGQQLVVMPNRTPAEVLSVMRNEEEIHSGYSGDNIKLKLKGVEEEDISAGFVLCEPSSVCHTGKLFDAQIIILEHKSIICAGYSAVIHIHTAVEEVQIVSLIALHDKKTGNRIPGKPRFVKQDQVVVARLETAGVICLETFKDFPRMARFILRDEGKTIAIGKVLKLM
ncbi:eukaryotic peptide chain release factor GTP-binding subunit ERF3A-like [Dysidea avara]|uniref:eukaryotic peptide chain release factor GTP-binding subunit ERF3A-like n=1 Tax=Dysidea avara TaxID=196820 RepID=UPI00332C6820